MTTEKQHAPDEERYTTEASSSASDADRYVVVIKSLDPIFNTFPVFRRRWEIQGHLHRTLLP
jgi:hypothetical protein